ncbi:GDSL-type esterase/lipase family protein [Actinacidiphila acidipaludis]|uniref:Lipase n=1 Tax=Actinacidiphila acidipaludis TaxID=2873382 RepID=A0ABS7Q659_9ACTN|nr:GDSL-type esterase/lipase family protein [Streptomyces acidipaludis]MBY8877920.1 lipase [Streptomyces acidipaludis]
MHTDDLTTTPLTAELLRGALDVERTERGLLPHRLPAWARAQNTDGQVAMVESQPSGVRLAVRTRATVLELDVLPTKRVYVGAPPLPDGVYELLVDGRPADRATAAGGNTLTVDMAAGTFEHRPGPAATLRFAGLAAGDKDVEIWLPHNETTELVALRADAPVEPAPDLGRRVWLHHGSSISHGSDAAGPTGTWPAVAAALSGVDLVNVGLGGSALLDPFVARALRDAPADVISLKIGINLVNADLMRLRAFTPAVHGFLDTIREGHPATPLLVVSPILCPMHEDTPGPTVPDMAAIGEGRLRFTAGGDPSERALGKLTLGVIRDELARIVAQRSADDPHLHYLDGRGLYGEADEKELPLPDGLHPDAATHRRMGERFAELAFGPGSAFAT